MDNLEILKRKCPKGHFERLTSIPNKEVIEFISKYVALCNPASVFVRTDSEEDAEYIRKKAIENGEEYKLKIEGHTVHFDGYFDQARDKKNTKFLIEKGMEFGKGLNVLEREKGLEEIHYLMKDIMKGKELFILFLCLGPVNSEFSLYAVQLTDSAYVAHSEDILYRPAYRVFLEKEDTEFFKLALQYAEEHGGCVTLPDVVNHQKIMREGDIVICVDDISYDEMKNIWLSA